MKQKGFTLLEVSLASVLLGLLIMGIFAFFSTTYINYLRLEEMSRMQDEARIVENFITQEIESAKTVTLIRDDGTIISIQSAPASWRKDEIKEVKLKSIILDDKDTTLRRSIEVTDLKTLSYTKGGASNVLTDLLKDKSIYISKDEGSDIITIRVYLEKERKYRASNPTPATHNLTTYIKVSLKYKYDV